MRVLLLSGSPQDASLVRQAFVHAVPDGTLDVRAPEEAADWLTTHPNAHAVIIAPDLTGSTAGGAVVSTVRNASATVPVLALIPPDDDRAEARVLLAGADAVVPAHEARTTRLATHLGALRPRLDHPDVREWRLLYAGRDTDLRREVARTLGSRAVLMSLWADGRLVPIIDCPGNATALVVDARDDADGMLLGLRQLRRALPTLPTVVVCDARFLAAFAREGVDACAASDVDAQPLLEIVADACAASLASAEVAALRARESRLRALVEQLPDPVLLVGVDRTVSAVNLAGLDVLGATDARHVIGLPLTDWLDVDEGDLGGFLDGVAAGRASNVLARTPRGVVPRQLLLRAVPFQREPDRPASVLLTLWHATIDLPAPLPADDVAPVPTISQADRDEAGARLAMVTHAHREATDALEAALERGARLEAQGEALDATRGALEAQVASGEARVASRAEQVTSLERDVASLSRERDDLRREVDDLQHVRSEVAHLKGAHQRLAALEDALADSQQVRAQALALEAEVSDLRDELDALRRRPATIDTHVDEKTLWLLNEVAAIGHVTTTAEARVLGANDIAARLLGYFSCDALQASGQLPAPILVAAGAFAQRPTRFEVCLQHGSEGPLHWLVGLATPHAGVPATVTWMLLDVTEQRLQARRARFLRRMDGLTHVLSAASAESTSLVTRAVHLLDAAADVLGARDDLDVAGTRTSLTRTQAVLTQLSGYARRRARREGVHDVRGIIDAASTVLVHLAGDDITCTVTHDDVPLHATLEPAELEPFLTSLVMSGREALPLGGHLSLTTQAVNTDTGNGTLFFMRPSIEVTLLAEGYGAQRPDGQQAIEESAERLGGTLVTTAVDRGEVRWVFRLARVFVTP